MAKFYVVRTDYPMEVHTAGCSDLHKRGKLLDGWPVEAATVADAVAAEAAALNHDFDSEYKVSDLLRIMPCCKRGI